MHSTFKALVENKKCLFNVTVRENLQQTSWDLNQGPWISDQVL
jgi:hypothetical protein